MAMPESRWPPGAKLIQEPLAIVMMVTIIPMMAVNMRLMKIPESRWPPGAIANPGAMNDCNDVAYAGDYDVT